jgi:hypothetical protein
MIRNPRRSVDHPLAARRKKEKKREKKKRKKKKPRRDAIPIPRNPEQAGSVTYGLILYVRELKLVSPRRILKHSRADIELPYFTM